MTIRWNGHACFTITTDSGITIVTDPFDASVGYERPTVQADVVTVSHQHFDHNDPSSLTGDKRILSEEGTYPIGDVMISAVSAFHDDEMGAKRGKNLLFKIAADGKTIVHLGDLGHMPDEVQSRFMEKCDALLIPIGGTYTVTTKQALEIIKKVKPSSVIPMHFKTEAISFPITDEKEFAENTGAVYGQALTVNVSDLPKAIILPYK